MPDDPKPLRGELDMLRDLQADRLDMIQDAERRMAEYVKVGRDDLHEKAQNLRDEIALDMGKTADRVRELETRREAVTGVDVIEQHVRNLEQHRREWTQRRLEYAQQVGEGDRFTEEYQRELMAEWDRTEAAKLEQMARDAWTAYEKAERAIDADLVSATDENARRYDLAALGTLITDFTSQLEAPPVAQGAEDSRTHRLRYVAALLDRVDAGKNPNEQRAARIAATPLVRSLMGSGDSNTDQMSRELNRRLAAMTEAEQGRVPMLQRKRAELGKRSGYLRGAILELERQATGTGATIWGVSRWQSSVLGEDMSTMGGGVSEVVTR